MDISMIGFSYWQKDFFCTFGKGKNFSNDVKMFWNFNARVEEAGLNMVFQGDVAPLTEVPTYVAKTYDFQCVLDINL